MKGLAPRQQEALTHKALGLTITEIADVMQCSATNVKNLLRECYFKLMARGATDAVAKAVKQGLINFLLLVSVVSPLTDNHQYRQPRRPGYRVTRIVRKTEIAA